MPKHNHSSKQISRLKMQLEGKEIRYSVETKTNQAAISNSETINYQPSSLSQIELDSIYLKKDLLKIFMITSLALAAQFGLYFAIQNHLIPGFN